MVFVGHILRIILFDFYIFQNGRKRKQKDIKTKQQENQVKMMYMYFVCSGYKRKRKRHGVSSTWVISSPLPGLELFNTVLTMGAVDNKYWMVLPPGDKKKERKEPWF